jgi:hypothetical protein
MFTSLETVRTRQKNVAHRTPKWLAAMQILAEYPFGNSKSGFGLTQVREKR